MKKGLFLILIFVFLASTLSAPCLSASAQPRTPTEAASAVQIPAGSAAETVTYGTFLREVAYPSAETGIALSAGEAETNGDTMLWHVFCTADGRYDVKLCYSVDDDSLSKIEGEILVNGSLQYRELSGFALQREYINGGEIHRDIYGNEIRPDQIGFSGSIENFIYDYAGVYARPLSVNLNAGDNTLALSGCCDRISLISVGLVPSDRLPVYEDYRREYENVPVFDGQAVVHEAERAVRKSDTILYAQEDSSDKNVSPSDPTKILLNTIGGSSWKTVNQYIEWEIEVPKEGLYAISLKARQNINSGQTSNRVLLINGEIPFKEAQYITVPYSDAWQNVTIGSDGEPYLFYLREGTNTIRLQATLGSIDEVIRTVDGCVERLNALYRRLLVILGTSPDTNRDYKLDKILPDVLTAFGEQADILEICADRTEEYNGGGNTGSALMRTMVRQLREMSNDGEEVVRQFSYFKTNIGSLGTWQATAKQQPLKLDRIYLSAPEEELPAAKAGFFSQLVFSAKQFLASFVIDYKNIGALEEQSAAALTAWISSGRDQAQVIRTMIGDSFTPGTGIGVKLELVTAASLLPATVAGIGPDVYIGTADVVNYAMRSAAYDITAFEDFGAVSERYDPVLFIPMQYQGGVYGLPYSMSCLMLYYRTDILAELGLSAPQTWDDVISMSSVLAVNSMSFGLPAGYNIFVMMLKQQGLDIYNQSGSRCLLDSAEAIDVFQFYTDFFNNYGFPLTYNFVNRFRTGEMPIAVAELENYSTLQISAPEIKGLWEMTNVPGFANGTCVSLATPTAVMMLAATPQPKETWQFMKWLTEAETQVRYGTEIESVLGPSGRYTSAVSEAFERSMWSDEEKARLGGQFSELCALEHVPGGYFLSRHLDNAFRNVVYKNKKPMDMLYDYVYKINQEITDKRSEFGLETE